MLGILNVRLKKTSDASTEKNRFVLVFFNSWSEIQSKN